MLKRIERRLKQILKELADFWLAWFKEILD